MRQICAISITDTAIRSYPNKHVSYQLTVKGTGDTTWIVWRRYSEFDALHRTLLAQFPHAPPPLPLPPKSAVSFSSILSFSLTGNASAADPAKIRDRRVGLEKYLEAMRTASDERWRSSQAWADFLGIPFDVKSGVYSSSTVSSYVPAAASSSSMSSSSGTSAPAIAMDPDQWIDEYRTVLGECRSIREAIATKEGFAASGNASATQMALVQIRNAVRAVTERVALLDAVLRDHVIQSAITSGKDDRGKSAINSKDTPSPWASGPTSPKGTRRAKVPFQALSPFELQRREDMLVNLKEEKDKVSLLMTSSAQSASHALMGTSSGGTDYAKGELLSQNGNSRNNRRAFGASAVPHETEETLALTNAGLVQLQERQMNEQDQVLESLSTVIGRQREIGTMMRNELELQNQMLGDLAEDVDRVSGNMKHVSKKMDIVRGVSKKR
ncbi:hypothetical protein HDU77_004707 [Chytriomyces hyalinus]|nr:hypothetical protein HDU77_004707 [Chytriomyces hyalinus]